VPHVLCGLDVHEIPAAPGEPAHLHHDLIWRLVARQEALRVSPESHALAWVPLSGLAPYELDAPLLANLADALALP